MQYSCRELPSKVACEVAGPGTGLSLIPLEREAVFRSGPSRAAWKGPT
ncbi:MAG: hypothetical protein OEW93_08195 [Candidatus Bathyarchaeota archaeon]|nr:hypothetical protein [Candidatus Bathyarchaeota archaeon]